jgi:hypothetical protein
MTAQELMAGKSRGVAFLVSAGIVYEIIAANCSSPQTTEINADTRAETLMKWVYLGLGQSAVFVGAAALFDPENAAPIILGGTAAAIVMWALYIHGKQAGLRSRKQGTEN